MKQQSFEDVFFGTTLTEAYPYVGVAISILTGRIALRLLITRVSEPRS